MILGVKKLLELVKKKPSTRAKLGAGPVPHRNKVSGAGKLVENLSERELNNPEGAGFDIRIGELYEVKGRGFLGVEERETSKIKLIAKVDKKKTRKVFLEPKIYYLMKTMEKLNLPENLLVLFTPRSTLYRSGVYIFGGQTAPGYQGELTTGIYNFRDEKFELEMGSRVLHIIFFEVKGKSNLYRGQWQGGRVATKKKEKQI